jgi:hypothetical protein
MSSICKKIPGFLLLFIALKTSAQSPVVKTCQGYIKGLYENEIAVFKGIPYAQPPVAGLRYMAPSVRRRHSFPAQESPGLKTVFTSIFTPQSSTTANGQW